jgi:hypothetical protein
MKNCPQVLNMRTKQSLSEAEVNFLVIFRSNLLASAQNTLCSHELTPFWKSKKRSHRRGKETEHDFLRAVLVHYFKPYFKACWSRMTVFGLMLVVCLMVLSLLRASVFSQQNLNLLIKKFDNSLINSKGANFSTDLPPNATAGGSVVPTDKFALLVPYIGLAATILVSVVATGTSVKHRHNP